MYNLLLLVLQSTFIAEKLFTYLSTFNIRFKFRFFYSSTVHIGDFHFYPSNILAWYLASYSPTVSCFFLFPPSSQRRCTSTPSTLWSRPLCVCHSGSCFQWGTPPTPLSSVTATCRSVTWYDTHRRKVTCAFCTCSIKRLKSATCESCLM